MAQEDLDVLMQNYQKEHKATAGAQPGDGQSQSQSGAAGEGTEGQAETAGEGENGSNNGEQQQDAGSGSNENTGENQGDAGGTPPSQTDTDTDATPPVAAQAPAQPGNPELTDDVVLKYLKETKGLSVDTLDGIGQPALTAEQQQQQAKEKRDKAITFALTEGIFDADTLQQYGVDNSRTAEELAYEAFSLSQKKDEPDLSEEDIRERFEDEYGLNQDEGSFRRKNGLQRLESFKQQLLNHKYGDVINAEQHYDAFVQQETNMKNYAKSVEDIFSGFDKEYTFQLSDKDNAEQKLKNYEYKFPYNDVEMEKLKKEFLSPDVLKKAAKGEVDVAALAQSVQMAVLTRFTKDIIKEVAYAYLSDKRLESEMERRGVLPANDEGSSQTQNVRKPNYGVAADFIEKATGRKIAV